MCSAFVDCRHVGDNSDESLLRQIGARKDAGLPEQLKRTSRCLLRWMLALTFSVGCQSYAQSALTIGEAVARAQEAYPSVQVTRAQVDAATAGIRLARTHYLPRVDGMAQVNRATRNNIYGMLMQQSVISPISGPPVNENSATSVFGSAVGMLVDWEPFDFGLRRSGVDLAESSRRRAEASVARSRFEAASAAADSYLTILAAQEAEKSARASIERSKVFLHAVEALVKAELRPGVDASVAKAELAAAQGQAVRGRQAVAEAKAILAGLLAEQPGNIAVVEGVFLNDPALSDNSAKADAPSASVEVSPLLEASPHAREQSAAIDEAKARRKVLDKQWAPRFHLQATTYARGSGARPDFTTQGGVHGLSPNFYNWGLGFTVTVPLMEFAATRAQQAEQSAKVRAEEGRYKQLVTDMDTRRNQAMAALEAAREMVALTPVQMESARAAALQAEARYRSGLSTVTEVADSQRLLTQAEIDHSLAKLNVWRALLGLRIAEGDLGPFLEMAGR